MITTHTSYFHKTNLKTNNNNLSHNIILSYHTSHTKTKINLITSTPPNKNNYFILTLTTNKKLTNLNLPINYIFILNISNNITNKKKINLSKNSIKTFINTLKTKNQFKILTFNIQPTTLFKNLIKTKPKTLKQTTQFLKSQQTQKNTILKPTINTTYKYKNPNHHLNIIILSNKITKQHKHHQLLQLIQQHPNYTTIFTININNKINHPLLSQLTKNTNKLTTFISQNNNFQHQTQSFHHKLTHPITTNINIALKNINTYNIIPTKLPNLYHKTPIHIFNHFQNKNHIKINITTNIKNHTISHSNILSTTHKKNPKIKHI